MKKGLILILFLAAILRFWNLGTYPALNADEAAIGYNAYSLIETGRDEHGNSWPVHFQSFNDFKPGLYFYLVLPFVKFLGLNEWAVRLPGATLGVASVFFLFLLVKELFKSKKLALASALFLAFSPWHIHFSRGAWEVNTATFLILAGIYFFIRGVNATSRKLITFSAISLVLSLYTYHASRVVVPLLGLGVKLLYKKEIKKNAKNVVMAAAIGAVIILPLVVDLSRGSVFSRAAGVGLFADTGPLSRINEQRGEHADFSTLTTKLLHNKVVNYGLAFLDNWVRHYHGEFLFLSGDEVQRNRVPETGQIHMVEAVFVLVGIFFIANAKKHKREWGLVLIWLLVAPTAAAFTFQSPHALRAQNMVIPLTVISAFGFVKILEWLGKRNWRGAIYLVILVLVWEFARYSHMYFVHMAKEYPFSSQYGVKELVAFVSERGESYGRVVVTDRYDQPYILFLFYLAYSPLEFQGGHVLTPRDEYGFSTVRDFGKYSFVAVDDWDGRRSEYPNSLIAGTPEEIPDEANVIGEIYGTNGIRYFEVVAN